MPPTPDRTLHMRIDKQLFDDIESYRKLAGRPKEERVSFLLEVGILVVHRNPKYRFAQEASDPIHPAPKMDRDLHCKIDDNLRGMLEEKAGRYGLSLHAMARVLIRTVLAENRRWAQGVRLIDKEELVELILKHQPLPQRVN